jgi:thioredoxin 1
MKMIYRFTANWCNPCKRVSQELERYGITLPTYDIDSPEGMELAKRYNVRSIPTIVIDNDGLVQQYMGGQINKDLYETLV